MEPRPSSNTTTQYNIYTGVWTDWSHGRVFGVTLTTTRFHGHLLIAFLSLFVTVVGTSFWRICCFMLHHIYSSKASHDALYHQRQAILRNSANATTGITSLFQVFTAWRNVQPRGRSCRSILPLLAFNCLIFAAFAVASTFSSRLTTIAGNAVLLSSRNCGVIRYSNDSSSTQAEQASILQPYISQKLTSDANYAQQCYPDHLNVEGCGTFVQRRLPTNAIRNAPCPFYGNICKSQDANLLLDTGLVDTHFGLGLNAPQDHRYQIRYVFEAAPLKTKGYTREVPDLGPGTHNPYTRYYFGPSLRGDMILANETYQHITLDKTQRLREYSTSARPNMDLKSLRAVYGNGTLDRSQSSFAPIKELERIDSDVLVAFLSMNALLFTEQSDDLWYSAHDFAFNLSNQFAKANDKFATYWSDETASPMGLVVQQQICRPDLPAEKRCTELGSWSDTHSSARRLWYGNRTNEVFEWFYVSMLFPPSSAITAAMNTMDQATLGSQSHRFAGMLGPLPSNQWQLDVEKWVNISLAAIQESMVAVATGPPDPRLNLFLYKPEGREARALCEHQKILSTAYINFSVFGLAVILIVGGLIVITSYTLEPVVAWIQRRRNLDVYSRFEWNMNETLQLQRLAHEELGLGSWHACDTDVPVTERFEGLAVLDLNERSHPRLKAPPPPFDGLLASEEMGQANGQEALGSGTEHLQEARAEIAAESSSFSSPGGGVSPGQPRGPKAAI